MVISTRIAMATVAAAALLGCAGTVPQGVGFDYFTTPDPDDAWSRKIEMWQARELADRVVAPAPVAGPGDDAELVPASGELRTKYDEFRNARKRAMAREMAEWIQDQAREHYVPDGPIDHWATLDETLRGNGDDCDGLELLVFHALRDLGFRDDEVYRAIVYRRSDGQHHMVTFWFEDRDDPWVIDPTGAMTSGMPRMSEVPGWRPLKVFSDDEEFSVHRQRIATR